MTGRWPRGEAAIDRLIAERALELIGRSASDGLPHLERAERGLSVATAALEVDADIAYVNAYDAARSVGTALLIQQGLRPTTQGGHRVVAQALVAQFGAGFAGFDALRRRRNEIQYPDALFAGTRRDEAVQAIETVTRYSEAAKKLLPQLGFFNG